MRNPFKKSEKSLTGTGDVLGAIQSGWQSFPILGGGAQERINNIYNTAQSASYGWMYANSTAVRTVVDLIVRNIGQLDLRLYEEVNEAERNPQPDHPAALSLRYPSETVTSDGLIRSLFKDYLIHDNAYALLTPAAGDQLRVIRIPAHMVEVQGASLFDVDNYRVWPQGAWTNAGSYGGGGTPIDLSPDQVLHWHGEHPHDPRVGLSRLDTLRDVIAEDAALTAAIVELAKNGLQAPIWISRPVDAPPVKAETLKKIEEDAANRMRSRFSKPPVFAEGMRLESFGTSPQDAQMMEVRRWALIRVAALYGVPLGEIGMDTHLQEAQSLMYSDCLPPYCEDFTRMLNQRLLVRVYDWTDGCFEFNLDEKLMGDDRIRTLVAATGRPVMLTNEGRAKLNLKPVDGGDELVTPNNVMVGDNPLPTVGVMPVQDPNGPAQDGSYRSDQGSANTPPKSLQKANGSAGDGTTVTFAAALPAGEPLPQFHPRYAADIDRQHRNIDLTQAVVRRHLNRLQRSLRDKSIKAQATDWDRWDREFATDLDKTLHQIVDAEGALYALKLGGYDFDMRRVQNYLKAMAEGAAEAINQKVREQIGEFGLDEAMNRLPQHVESAGASLGVHSTVWAREEAARQSGTFEQRVKTWVADTDRHADFNGDTVPLGDDWPAGFAPGTAPNCKCTASIS